MKNRKLYSFLGTFLILLILFLSGIGVSHLTTLKCEIALDEGWGGAFYYVEDSFGCKRLEKECEARYDAFWSESSKSCYVKVVTK